MVKRLIIHQDRITPETAEELKALCPFDAIEGPAGALRINAACKMCGLCVKDAASGLVEIIEEEAETVDKAAWRGLAVFIDYTEERLHPVSLELLGKARELAGTIGHPVYALLIGSDAGELAHNLLRYGVDAVYCYDDRQFQRFLIEPYAAAVGDFIREVKPSAILFGATNAGRSLAPRIAARFRTGLTADCTSLEIREDSDLVQIRPAFGGNIMAQIRTANNRPQLCTVRYKIFDRPEPGPEGKGKIHTMRIGPVASGAEILQQIPKPKQIDISDAELILALGRGISAKKDLAVCEEFAALIGAQIACTRPLAEAGWLDPRLQIGLSGRTVKPKLIICAGISGSVQFAAGMKGSDFIVAINADPEAPIFKIAHLGLVGDLYEILPQTLDRIRTMRESRTTA